MATNYIHLSKEKRSSIEYLINQGFSFTYIANSINVDRTTVAKEIKRNRYIKNNLFSDYSETGIKRAISSCEKLSKPPYCCNKCKSKNFCTKYHLYYNATKAHNHYLDTLSQTRKGLDITKEEIDQINKNIIPLIKNKNQSVNQVFINHPDILYMSKPTFYKYVDLRVIALSNLDLPKKVTYKKRKHNKNKTYKRELALSIGRTYEDYIIKINTDKNLIIWQLDTVIGKNSDNKVLMTFLLAKTNYMIIRLLDKKAVEFVNKEFTKLKNDLGTELYSKFINIILTDNGTEFFDPIHMEYDLETGEKLLSVYYCHPNSPEEKPELECNHKYIRYFLPKKTSFESLTLEQVKNIEDNINNIPRDIFGGKTPYELTIELYPELIELLGSKFIAPDDVTLNPKDIFGDKNGR